MRPGRRFQISLVLVLLFFLLAKGQPVIDCTKAPLYSNNERITHVIVPDDAPQRCYRFGVPPAAASALIIVEPCTGPVPVIYWSNSPLLTRSNFTGTSNAIDAEFFSVVSEVPLKGGAQIVYVLVTHPEAGFNIDSTKYALRFVDGILPKLPLPNPKVTASRRTDTSLRLTWETATDARGVGSLDYAIYSFEDKPAYLVSIFSRRGSPDFSLPYFFRTYCSANEWGNLERPFSVLSVNLRGETYILSRDKKTLIWDISNLKHGFKYRFLIFARNVDGTIAIYDQLVTYTWQIGPLGTTILPVMLLVFLVNLATYLYLTATSKKKRDRLFVTIKTLPKGARWFVASDIEGYFYVLPKRVIKSILPDEEIVWAGRPDYERYTSYWAQAYFVLAAILMLILFVIGWLFTETWTVPVLWPYLSVYFGSSLLFFVMIPYPARTVYALTTTRAIIYKRYFWAFPRLYSYPYEQMYAGHISSDLQSNQDGSVFFELTRPFWPLKRRANGFWYVQQAYRAVVHISHFREAFYKKFFLHDQPFAMAGNNNDEDDDGTDNPRALLMR